MKKLLLRLLKFSPALSAIIFPAIVWGDIGYTQNIYVEDGYLIGVSNGSGAMHGLEYGNSFVSNFVTTHQYSNRLTFHVDMNGTLTKIGSINANNASGPKFGLLDSSDNYTIEIKNDTYIKFLVNNDTKMHIDSTGYVGIGTPSPSSLLHLDGGDLTISETNGAPFLKIVSSDPILSHDEPYIALEAEDMSSDIQTWYFRVDQSIGSGLSIRSQFNGGGQETRLFLEPDGDVGIGTESPSAKFHVAGTAKFDGEVDIDSIPAKGDIGMGIFGD